MRPTHDTVMLTMARTISLRGTCRRRRVGCVLTDVNQRVLSMGFNGNAKNEAHCIDVACLGASAPSGTGLELCEALHAEMNALLFCADIMKIDTCYCTTSPCRTCVKMLMQTSCQRIVFLETYPHADAEELWVRQGRRWEHHGEKVS